MKPENQGRRGLGKEPQGSVPEAAAKKTRPMRQKFTIHVSPEFPPIPDRSADYAAWIDGEEETTTCTGPTASAALIALAERIEEAASNPNLGFITPVLLRPYI
jgi:hypothetical protein